MSYHVERIRLGNVSADGTLYGGQSGDVRHSRTFRTLKQAQHEADAWEKLDTWTAFVREGPAPRKRRHSKSA